MPFCANGVRIIVIAVDIRRFTWVHSKTVKESDSWEMREYVKKNQNTYVMNLDQYNSLRRGAPGKKIENLQQNIESQQEYKDHSILMNINPYDEYVETATFLHIDRLCYYARDAVSEPRIRLPAF